MATVNEVLLERSISHAIGLHRLSNGIVRKIIGLLNKSEADLVAQIKKYVPAGDATFTQKRLERLLEAVRAANKEAYAAVRSGMASELRGLAAYEATFQSRMITAAAPIELDIVTPSAAQLYAAVQARPFQGRFLREWYQDLEAGAQTRLRDAIRIGFVEGETIDQMVRRVRGTRAQQYKDGILETSRRSAERIVRTAVNHTANVARNATYAANSEVIKGVRWVSTLDTRTSLICADRDGDVYPIDSGPRPPAHPNCRSSTAPVLKSWQEMGIDLAEAPESTRASMDGQVPASLTYEDWLKKQPAAIQDEALGPSRAALFRSGGMPIDKFTDDRGNTLTLDQLKASDNAAFEAAGLNNPVRPPRGVPQDEIARFLADPDAQRDFMRRMGNYDYHLQQVREVREEEGWDVADEPLLAIRHYTGSAYHTLNRRMREGMSTLDDRKFTALANVGVEALPNPQGGIWRAPRKRADAADSLWNGATVGKEINLGNQLQSFTADRDIAERWGGESRLVLHIENPRHGAYIEPLSQNPGEEEVLLPAGLPYRVVAKREEERSGVLFRVLVVEVVEND